MLILYYMTNNHDVRNGDFLSPTQLGAALGVSRITIHKRIKKGEIPAQRIGRNYIIPKSFLNGASDESLSEDQKTFINKAVKKTVREYGEALRLLGKE